MLCPHNGTSFRENVGPLTKSTDRSNPRTFQKLRNQVWSLEILSLFSSHWKVIFLALNDSGLAFPHLSLHLISNYRCPLSKKIKQAEQIPFLQEHKGKSLCAVFLRWFFNCGELGTKFTMLIIIRCASHWCYAHYCCCDNFSYISLQPLHLPKPKK